MGPIQSNRSLATEPDKHSRRVATLRDLTDPFFRPVIPLFGTHDLTRHVATLLLCKVSLVIRNSRTSIVAFSFMVMVWFLAKLF